MKIKMLVMDVDGTMTDGNIYMGAQGEMMKAFNVQDGYGIAGILPKKGIIPVIITGRESEIVARRAAELRIPYVYQGVFDKLAKLKELAVMLDVPPKQIAYIGDDLNDLECMRWCGYSACPADAVEEVQDEADYICERSGGHGAVRELIDQL